MANRIRLKENQDRLFLKSNNAEKIKMKYPHIQDERLQKKIALKKEFQHFYESGVEKSILQEDKDGALCSFKDFELAPHQQFVKTFMSQDTPYNGLLLYHGMGSGKTCSAIGICEEYRKSQHYNVHFKKIIIVASKNVQENFKSQWMDMEQLKLVNGIWTMSGCVGNSVLQELHLQNLKQLSKKEIHQKVLRFINKKYLWNEIYLWIDRYLDEECSEYLISMMMEPYDKIIEPLVKNMSSDEDKYFNIPSSRKLLDLKKIIETKYKLILNINFKDKKSNTFFLVYFKE